MRRRSRERAPPHLPTTAHGAVCHAFRIACDPQRRLLQSAAAAADDAAVECMVLSFFPVHSCVWDAVWVAGAGSVCLHARWNAHAQEHGRAGRGAKGAAEAPFSMLMASMMRPAWNKVAVRICAQGVREALHRGVGARRSSGHGHEPEDSRLCSICVPFVFLCVPFVFLCVPVCVPFVFRMCSICVP